MEERYCNDYFFDAYVEVLSKYTEEKLDDKMNPKTLNLVLAYLPINDSVIRFPHDTWPDVLQGWGDMNPFSTELRMINRAFADSGIFQDLKKEVVQEVWNSTYERYKRTPSRQKNSFLALADTLFQNFTIDELKELGVDIDIVRQVASTYSHIPQAAKLISKIQAVLPQTVTRIINMQDIGSESSHAPYKIQEMYLIYNDGRMLSSLMDEAASGSFLPANFSANLSPIPAISLSSEGFASRIELWLVKPALNKDLALTLPMESISKRGSNSFLTPLDIRISNSAIILVVLGDTSSDNSDIE
tara:strand:- start:41 stop:943 length:903 start_codon:yes stop_codon:yes gene_type:complete